MSNVLKDFIIFIVIYHFLSEIIKTNKCNNLVCNFYDKNMYVIFIHIRALKQVLNRGLIF